MSENTSEVKTDIQSDNNNAVDIRDVDVDKAEQFRNAIIKVREFLDESRNFSRALKKQSFDELDLASNIFEDLLEELYFQQEQNEKLKDKIKSLEVNNKTNVVQPVKPTYSQVVARPLPTKADNAVLVYPSDENEKVEPYKLLQQIQKDVNLKEIKVGIRNTKPVKSGILVNCCTQEGAIKLRSTLTTIKNYEVKQPRKLRPRIMISRIPIEDKPDDIVNTLQLFNTHMEEDTFKHPHFHPRFVLSKNNNYNTCTWVIELSARARKEIKENNEFLCLGWQTVKIRDFHSFKRCNSCWAYGHLSKDCRTGPVCPCCAEAWHSERECRRATSEYQCVNCIRYNKTCKNKSNIVNHRHHVKDRHCPFYKHQCEISKLHTETI